MGSSLGVGEDPAATAGSGAVAGASVGRGVVATSGWRGVSWDCIRSDRSACGAAVGPATVGGSCPAVHAAKINEDSRAVAISLDILWLLFFNSPQPRHSTRGWRRFFGKGSLTFRASGRCFRWSGRGTPGSAGAVRDRRRRMMDLWNLHQVRRPRESRLVGRLQLASSPPLVHLRGTWWSGHTGQRACCSPKQYRRLDFRRWAHGGQRKGPWGSIIRMMRSLSGSRCRRPVPAVSGEVRGYGSCRVPPQVAAAPSTVPSGQQDHSSQDDQLSHGMFHWASSAARRSATSSVPTPSPEPSRLQTASLG